MTHPTLSPELQTSLDELSAAITILREQRDRALDTLNTMRVLLLCPMDAALKVSSLRAAMDLYDRPMEQPEPEPSFEPTETFSDYWLALDRAQALADQNEAPVVILEREHEGLFAISEQPTDNFNPDPTTQGWSERALVEPTPDEADTDARLENEHWERKISEARNGDDL